MQMTENLRLSNMYTMLLRSSYTILIVFLQLLPNPFQAAPSLLLVLFVYLVLAFHKPAVQPLLFLHT